MVVNNRCGCFPDCGCKGREFLRTDQMFWRFFSKKVYFTPFFRFFGPLRAVKYKIKLINFVFISFSVNFVQ